MRAQLGVCRTNEVGDGAVSGNRPLRVDAAENAGTVSGANAKELATNAKGQL